MEKTRGFITIATGEERYFKLARNLCYSYQYFASVKYPFAIICDKENDYTKEFDDVILIANAHRNYLDKLSLYEHLPYDETIFIDADCLAYGDLDQWWKLFEKADDFSLIGYMWTDLTCGKGWFVPDGLKEYRNKVEYIPDFNGGMYYMRKSETCKEVFRLANFFAEHYGEYQFNGFKKAADEPVLALAMAIQRCRPLDILEGGLVFSPKGKRVELDITIPRAYYHRTKAWEYSVILVHWSNYRTMLAPYKFEVRKLIKMRQNKTDGLWYKLLYEQKWLLFLLKPMDIWTFLKRIVRKAKRAFSKN